MDRVGFVAPKRPKMGLVRESRKVTDISLAEFECVAASEEVDFDLEILHERVE